MYGRWRDDNDSGPLTMRHLFAVVMAMTLAGLGCPAGGTPNQKPNHPGSQPTVGQPGEGQPRAQGSAATRFTPPDQVPVERRVWAYIDGQRRVMDIDEARSVGLTVIDLSDDWVPFIFWSQTPGADDHKPNLYIDDYVRLANDVTNLDGHRLGKHRHNYLEVYGIPASLSVLRRRFVEDDQKPCFKELDYEIFSDYHGPVRVVDPVGSRRLEKRYYSARAAFRAAQRRSRLPLERMLEHAAYRKVARKYQKARWQYKALRAMQKRLVCEGVFNRRKPRIKLGVVDWKVRQALKRFERKHNVYGWGMIFQKTANALGRRPLDNNFESLKRVLAERVISAAGILEDGTAGRKATFVAADGSKQPVRNLVAEFTEALLKHMGLTDADKAKAFITGHAPEDFKRMYVAVKLPPLPEYYSDHMDLQTVIDRGDVWYDLPYTDKGRRKAQPRSRLPSLSFYVNHNGHKVRLVRWRTTIGGWNHEMRNNEEYVKYKMSDVGKRVWRHIVAGPVWVPPKATPSKDMVKFSTVRGRSQRVVSQSTVGPGYASAYGLVAAFHVTKAGHDNQIRTHGSVNYMSIMGRFSHGCHRLFNYRAVRLFSYVLRHRKFKRIGQSRLRYHHRFEHKGEEFQINLHTRGYYYELTPPVPVNVLEGRIRGTRKSPYEEYIKKPGKVYQDDVRQKQPKKNGGSSMTQKQTI